MDVVSIISGIGVPVGLACLGVGGRWILAGQNTIKRLIAEGDSAMDVRVKAVETDIKRFLDKDDINKLIEHEKNGRAAIEQASTHLIEKNDAAVRSDIKDNTEAIVKLRESVARLDQNDTYLSKEVSVLTARMDKGFAKLEEKMDKMADCMTEIAKKV